MNNDAMPKKNNEMSFYDSDFEGDFRWGVCDDCYSEIEEYDDEIDADKTPHDVVLIVNENDGDDYRQLKQEYVSNAQSEGNPFHQTGLLEYAIGLKCCLILF